MPAALKGRTRNMHYIIVPLIFLLLCFADIQKVWSDSPGDEEKVYAIQNRIFHRNHELDINLGYSSGDDFYNVYPIGIGYTYHFNNHFSWEVVRAHYMFNMDKGLKSDLENNFGVTPEEFPEPIYMLHSHLVFKPLYGKSALLNRRVINNEIYVFGGPGIAHYEWQHSTGETTGEDAISISIGAGLRYFVSKKFCLTFEIRDLMHLREDTTENNLYFGVGFGYRFNFRPRKVEEDPTTKKLKRILDEDK
jgi:outer membrane beta-barrel protein